MPARTLLEAPEPPDALLCANDHMAAAALTVATRECGRIAGVDLSVVSFDDMPQAAMSAGLTTHARPVAAMAEHAVGAALAMIDDEAVPERLIVTGRLVVRVSSRILDGCPLRAGETIWPADLAGLEETGR